MARTPNKTKKNARKPASKIRTIKSWTTSDLKILRKESGRMSAGKIAKALKRTEGAVRQKAGALGVSLRLR